MPTAGFSVSVADADRYRLVVAGLTISAGAGHSGYDDGEFFRVVQEGDSYIVVEGSDGSVVRSKTEGQVLIMTLNLLQSSVSNAKISALYASDVNNPNGAGIGSLVLDGLDGENLILCTNSWITKPTNVLLGPGATVRSWPIWGIYSVYKLGYAQ